MRKLERKMKNKTLIVFVFIVALLFSSLSKAVDYTLDDSCTQGIGILNRIVDDITTLGLFEAYSSSFHMYGANGYASSDSDSVNGCSADYYPDCSCASMDADCSCGSAYTHLSTDCQQDGTNCCDGQIYGGEATCANACNPEGGMQWCYDQWDPLTLDYEPSCYWTKDGYSNWFFYPPGQIRIASDGDKLCAQFATTIGYQNIGCKYLPSCTQFNLDSSCYVAPSCYSFSAQASQALLPITSAIVQCINDSISYLFYTSPCTSADSDYTVTVFPEFQSAMRNAVRSALMLYVILFGLKTVLAAEHPSKGEFFKMGAKFILVLYFSTGINIDPSGQPSYDDGIHRYMLPLYTSGAAELADMVYSAGGSPGLCAYDMNSYPSSSNGTSYGYLSMWDGIDCRLLYYFGFDIASIDTDTPVTMSDIGALTLLGLLLPAFFSFQLIFLIFSIAFAIMLLSVVIYFVNLTVISAILVAILIYLAPLFVPMALFEATKEYYDNWLKTTTSYALQPMIIAAYIAMMLTIFDQTMFGDCVFKNKSITYQMGSTGSGSTTTKEIPFFLICDPHDASENCSGYDSPVDSEAANVTQCSETIGWYLNPIQEGKAFTNSIDAIFFNITLLNSNVATDMLTGLITLTLFGYLFYKFGDALSDFAAELTGGNNIGSAAGNPMKLVEKAANAAVAAIKYAVGDTKGAAQSAAKAASSDDEGSKRSGATSSSSGGGGGDAAKSAGGGGSTPPALPPVK